jgi:hypothetical protein
VSPHALPLFFGQAMMLPHAMNVPFPTLLFKRTRAGENDRYSTNRGCGWQSLDELALNRCRVTDAAKPAIFRL